MELTPKVADDVRRQCVELEAEAQPSPVARPATVHDTSDSGLDIEPYADPRQPKCHDDRLAGEGRHVTDDEHPHGRQIDAPSPDEAKIVGSYDLAFEPDRSPYGPPVVCMNECAHLRWTDRVRATVRRPSSARIDEHSARIHEHQAGSCRCPYRAAACELLRLRAQMKTEVAQAAQLDFALPRGIRWVVGILGAITLIAAFLVPVGLAALFLAPMAAVFGIGMWAVWLARRRRQSLEGRDAEELKNAFATDRQWPTEGIIDDRLEDPLALTNDESLALTNDERRGGPP